MIAQHDSGSRVLRTVRLLSGILPELRNKRLSHRQLEGTPVNRKQIRPTLPDSTFYSGTEAGESSPFNEIDIKFDNFL